MMMIKVNFWSSSIRVEVGKRIIAEMKVLKNNRTMNHQVKIGKQIRDRYRTRRDFKIAYVHLKSQVKSQIRIRFYRNLQIKFTMPIYLQIP